MIEACETTKRHPLTTIELRSAPLVLPHREGDQTADGAACSPGRRVAAGVRAGSGGDGAQLARSCIPRATQIDVTARRFRRGPDRAVARRKPGGLSASGPTAAARHVRHGDRLRRVRARLHSDRRCRRAKATPKARAGAGSPRKRKPDDRGVAPSIASRSIAL